jgi:hypothetical protein
MPHPTALTMPSNPILFSLSSNPLPILRTPSLLLPILLKVPNSAPPSISNMEECYQVLKFRETS